MHSQSFSVLTSMRNQLLRFSNVNICARWDIVLQAAISDYTSVASLLKNSGATMNKRTFMKLCSAMIAEPILRPLLTCASSEKLKNWAGDVE